MFARNINRKIKACLVELTSWELFLIKLFQKESEWIEKPLNGWICFINGS